MKEFDFIRTLKKLSPLPWERTVGNDSAFFKLKHKRGLISKDILLEDQHFFSSIPADALAYKSLAVNISDIVSDGGTPRAFLIGLGASSNHFSILSALFESLYKYARQWNIPIIGGDTVYSDKLLLSITCLGDAPQNPWFRKNARLGDYLYITGTLGSSAWGLSKIPTLGHELSDPHIKRHLYPPLYLDFPSLFKNKIHAAIDISDGFYQDLTHLLEESNLSAVITPETLPLDPSLPPEAKNTALRGGEDYELLFASPLAPSSRRWPPNLQKIPIAPIGKIIN
ncbi:MAG: thiamine-phosphate kinase, partial [Spirochaetae bacterium HGW-Spirochaetae-6]